MKLGFWTLYDVEWTNEEIAQRAAALGYNGVDLRVAVPGVKPGVGVNLSLDSTDEEIASTRGKTNGESEPPASSAQPA